MLSTEVTPARVHPNLPLTITILCWGFNFVALKAVYVYMTPAALSVVRLAAMFPIVLLWMALQREPFTYPKGQAWRILLVGAIALGIYMILFLEGMLETTPAEGAIMLATAPVFTYLMACMVRQESFVPSALGLAGVAFAGVALVVFAGAADSHGSLFGNGMVLASSVVWSFAVVLMRPLLADIHPTRLLALSMPGGIAVLMPYGLASVFDTNFARIDVYGWAMFAHVAFLSGVVAFVCFYEGIRQVGPATATLYQYFTPLVAALSAWVVLHQSLQPLQWLGMLVVLLGVSGSTYARARAARQVEL